MQDQDTTSNDPILTDEELEALAELIRAEEAKAEAERRQILEDLAFAVQKKWEDRAARRATKETEWLEAQRLYLGSIINVWHKKATYSDPFNERTGVNTSHPEPNIVRPKCRTMIANLTSMQFAGGSKNWDINPSPFPEDLDPQIKSTIIQRCEDMERQIYDQLIRACTPNQEQKAIEDRVILGTGIMKGPTNKSVLTKKYIPTEEGTWPVQIVAEKIPEVRRVNPWFFYPDDSVTDIREAEDAIEIHLMSKSQLKDLAKDPMFDSTEVYEVCKEPPKEYVNSSYADFTTLTEQSSTFRDKYVVLEYHGPITKDQLGRLDIDPGYDTPADFYFGQVFVCQGRVIGIELSNIEGDYQVPYAVGVFEPDPGSIFGIGAPILLMDHQRTVRALWKMILDNSAMSSGPQMGLNRELIKPHNGSWEIEPWKIWDLTEYGEDIQKALQWFTPDNNLQQLLAVYDKTKSEAEEESLVPLIQAGLQSPQVGDSATGTALLMEASTTVQDNLNERWDRDVVERYIKWMYDWNMQYGDPTAKGDYEVDVRSSSESKGRQMELKNLEKIGVRAAQDPEFGIWINKDQMQQLEFSMMDLPSQNIIRSPQEVEQIRQQMQEEAANRPDPEMIKLQIEQEKLKLEREKLMFERQQQQQREIMDHQEKMSANYARMVEAEASVMKSQNEKETALIQLAAKQELDMASLMKDYQIAVMNDQTKKLLGSMDHTRAIRDQLLYKEEMELKRQEGEGI